MIVTSNVLRKIKDIEPGTGVMTTDDSGFYILTDQVNEKGNRMVVNLESGKATWVFKGVYAHTFDEVVVK